jgi:steroid delta-isomerase-like uncharacterized protein
MDALDLAHRYFDAWNRRDAAGLIATFADGATYRDPATGQPLTGPAIAAYVKGLWAAFPDLSFKIVSAAPAGDGMIAAEWLMCGTNNGSLLGQPPTGRAVALPGADFIRVDGEKIRSVEGYFDMKTLWDQLGLQTVVQPYTLGPFAFGTSVSVQTGKRTRPGAFSMTAIQVRSDEEVEQVRAYSRQIAIEMLEMPGFISWLAATIGHWMVTVTAWESPENPRQLMRNGTHKQAMQTFYGPEFSSGGMTSVWTPDRINTAMRCPACGRMVSYDQSTSTCACGELLPEPLPFW